jgi:hypothetical protein
VKGAINTSRRFRLSALGFSLVVLASPAFAQAPADFKGLQMTVTGIERAMNVPLIDCPPGANIVRGNAKPGEEFAVVTLAFKVTPAFKETVVKKPVLVDATGKSFNTSVAIIDPGSVPEYKCSFPFRVPAGTRVKSLQVDAATLDLTPFDKK